MVGSCPVREHQVTNAQKNKVSEARNLAMHLEVFFCFGTSPPSRSSDAPVAARASTQRCLEAYPRAIKIFEDIAKACMESATMQYSAKDYFFMASLCHLTEACDKKEPMQDTKAAMTRSLGGGSPGHPESVHFPS